MTPQPNSTRRIGRRTFLKTGAAVAGGVLGTGRVGATTASRPPGFLAGESTDVGDGEVTAYATAASEGTVSSLGVHVDGTAMDALGGDEVAADLALPAETSAGTALDTHQFTFLRVEYLPEGHFPEGVYDVAHFDFHFFMLDVATVNDIEEGPADYSIPDAQLPAGHVRPPLVDTDGDGEPDAPLVEAGRGEPIVAPDSPEFREGDTFTHAHIYGAYDPDGDGVGQLILFEPMVTPEFLDGRDTVLDVELETPERYFAADRYPTRYVVQPAAHGGAYVFLDDFEAFPGPNE